MMDTRGNYEQGYEAGLDAIEALSQAEVRAGEGNASKFRSDSLTGLLSSVMSCVYSLAPSEEGAEELIKLAKEIALENVKGEE
jgi:hypothetical protein